MTHHAEWSTQEIERLRNAFLNGEKIKLVARELGRTHTALNKALSRFGIRAQKDRPIIISHKDQLGYISLSSNIKDSNLVISETSDTQSTIIPPNQESSCINFFIKKRHKANGDQKWVTLEKVVNYLLKQGFLVTPVAARNAQSQAINFLINNKPVSTAKLVFLANRLRLEEKKPIFYVSEVTW